MAVKIELKRSSVPGKIPTTASLDLGELAINTYDGAVYLKQEVNTTQSIISLISTAYTGSLPGTASQAISASYALTASYALSVSGTIDNAISASYALTASYAPDYVPNRLSGSFATTGSNTFIGNQVVTGSISIGDNIYGRNNIIFANTSSIITYTDGYTTFKGATGTNAGVSLQSNNGRTYVEAYPDNAYISTTNQNDEYLQWAFTDSGSLRLPTSGAYAILNPDSTPWTASYAATASNILGGKATHVPFFLTDTTLATSSMYQSGSSTIIINQDNATSENPEALYVWQSNPTSINVISGKGNLNSYLQLNIQNTNQGTNASSDVVATAGNGNENGNFIDMGINSDNFSGYLGGPNDAYLYTTGSHLHIGNATPDKPIQFFVGGPDTNTNRKLELNANDEHNITGSLEIDTDLVVLGGITGSLLGTASYADSAFSSSYALTASYALNTQNVNTSSLVTTSSFNSWTGSNTSQFAGTSSYAQTASYAPDYLPLTGGTINGNVTLNGTASITFLNVTYESSSVIYSSGSNIFGSSTANTQTLIGTVKVSGSQQITGSLNAPHITGSLQGTASWASNSISASHVLNAVSSSYASTASVALQISASVSAQNLQHNVLFIDTTGPQYPQVNSGLLYNPSTNLLTTTASLAVSASHALTASYSQTASYSLTAVSASFALTASYVTTAQTASYVLNAVSSSQASTASYITTAQTASYVAAANVVGTVTSASHANQADNAATANFATAAGNGGVTQIIAGSGVTLLPPTGVGNVTIITTGGGGTTIISGSNVTASFAPATTWTFTHNLGTRTPVITVFDTNYNQIIPQNITLTNTSSATITFPTAEAGFAIASTGGTSGTALSSSYSLYSTYATTASYYVETDPIFVAKSGSYATTGSNTFRGNQIITGSIFVTGSSTFVGDQVITGSIIVSSSNSITVIGPMTITGSLLVSGSTIQVGSNTLTGNTILSGSILVSGSQTFKGNLDLTGSLLVSGSTTQIGNNTLIGNTILSGSLSVSGSQIYKGNMNLTGSLTVSGSTFQIGNNTLSGNTVLSGSITISGSTTNTIIGNTQVYGEFNVSGSSVFSNSTFTVTGSQFFTGSSNIVGNQSITGSLNVIGNINVVSGSAFSRWGNKLFNYAQFAETASLPITQNVSGAFLLPLTYFSEGISVTSGSRITFENTGLYNIQFSAVVNQGAGKPDFSIWFKQTGSNIANSNTIATLQANSQALLAWNFAYPFASGSYVEMWYNTTAANTVLTGIAAINGQPASPALIVTVTQIA